MRLCRAQFFAVNTPIPNLFFGSGSAALCLRGKYFFGYFIAGGSFESLGLLLVLYALTFGPVVMVTPLTATLPLWVVIGSKLFLNDVEKITTRIAIGALLVVLGTIAISFAKD